MSRKVAVFTGTRAEFGLLHWLLQAFEDSTDFELRLVVTGAHLSPEFGMTVRDVVRAGFAPDESVEMLMSSDSVVGMTKAVGIGIMGFADVLRRMAPDLVLVLGDRFEAFSAVSAAALMRIPVAHLCGGEVSTGAVDDSLRHAMTKLAHLHLVATEEFGRRVRQMGEEDWRIAVVGSPGLEAVRRARFLDKPALERRLELKLSPPLILLTLHPATVGLGGVGAEADSVVEALVDVAGTIVASMPNADAGGRTIAAKLRELCSRHSNARLYDNLGPEVYLSLLRLADVMVGNSSSGLIEAPSFELPVVNVGIRQEGRLRASNVIDVDSSVTAIKRGLQRALTHHFRASLHGLVNPYGDGRTSERVLTYLRSVPEESHTLLRKAFVDRT